MKAIKAVFRAVHGESDDGRTCRTCRTCSKCVRIRRGKRSVYKCLNMGITASTATDIRLKDKACDLWEEALPY